MGDKVLKTVHIQFLATRTAPTTNTAENKTPMQTVATMRWTLSFGIVLHSMELFDSVVLASCYELVFGDHEACGKSWCNST